jgi:hypothetical protein
MPFYLAPSGEEKFSTTSRLSRFTGYLEQLCHRVDGVAFCLVQRRDEFW